jgi:hypothetical protein
MQRCLMVSTLRIDIRAVLKQYLHSFSTPNARRQMQRRQIGVILCVDVGAMLDQ